jgi:Zn-dependent oligopeptidase
MAKTPHTVLNFLDHLLEVAKPAAERDLKAVSDFAAAQGADLPIQPWDFSYWSEKLKMERLSLDDQALKPYFKLENVLQGAFIVAGRLFGLHFKHHPGVPVYHENVDAYEVFDADGNFLSLFYADFFPRDGKRAGAWMTSYQSMYTKEGIEVRPHISIVCNFTKPTASKPSLLTFNEVTTLFHEFGHALHGMMARGTYPSLTGTSVYWDFVELPSQIMENWCYQPEALALFAKHYDTGAVLPTAYIDKIKESQTFLEGYMTLRQLNFGYLDMSWHDRKESFEGDVASHEKAATAHTSLFPEVEGTLSSTAFSHIFQGGYSAGYYSYKWAEVLDADAFERFEEEGLFNPQVAADFAMVLQSGGTVAPDELYRNFRGRDPKVDALLKRAGILA